MNGSLVIVQTSICFSKFKGCGLALYSRSPKCVLQNDFPGMYYIYHKYETSSSNIFGWELKPKDKLTYCNESGNELISPKVNRGKLITEKCCRVTRTVREPDSPGNRPAEYRRVRGSTGTPPERRFWTGSRCSDGPGSGYSPHCQKHKRVCITANNKQCDHNNNHIMMRCTPDHQEHKITGQNGGVSHPQND